MAAIAILSLNYAPEPVGVGPYSQGWAEYLVARGHRVRVVCGPPHYPDWQIQPGYSNEYSATTEAGVEIVRVPVYVPRKPTGPKRLALQASFARSASRAIRNWRGAFCPEVTIAVAPALLAAPVAARLARTVGGLSWLHIQDLEAEAAVATGLLPPFTQAAALAVERRIMQQFDILSTISPAMRAKAADKVAGCAQVHELRNWAEPEVLAYRGDGGALREELQIPDGPVALYSGTLALKQGVGIIAEAARIASVSSGVQFVVCGAGPAKAALEQTAATLPNLHLRPLQPRARLPELLGLADVHLLPQIAEAADLVLPSKLPNMLASARPVIAAADPSTSLAEEVRGCGMIVPPGDPRALASALALLADNAEKRQSLGLAAHERARERWEKFHVLSQLQSTLDAALGARAR